MRCDIDQHAACCSVLDGLLRARTDCIVWGSQFNPSNCTTPSSLIAPDGLVSGAYWAPGIINTFGMVALNVISWEAVTDEGFDSGVAAKARAWVTFSLILMCCALGGGIWIMVAALNEPGALSWFAVFAPLWLSDVITLCTAMLELSRACRARPESFM